MQGFEGLPSDTIAIHRPSRSRFFMRLPCAHTSRFILVAKFSPNCSSLTSEHYEKLFSIFGLGNQRIRLRTQRQWKRYDHRRQHKH
jgi:hypothetical protein